MAQPQLRELSVELETALVRALLSAWRGINYQFFRRSLRPPLLALHDSESRLGLWNPNDRTLTLSRTFVMSCPWTEVIEVLKHEVAHQFVHEVMGITDETSHGPNFQRVCAQHGIDGTASGRPNIRQGEVEALPVFRRISKLLALAESPNLHEAEVAMKQAQRLMLKHNIDAQTAQAHEGYGYRHVGTAKGRRSAAEKTMAGLLERFFFVSPIWVPYYRVEEQTDAWILELSGTPSNLEVAAWVHDFLLGTAERLWKEHKRAKKIKSDSDRREFILGVVMGFEAKLALGAAENQQEGLVWKGDPRLTEYLHRRHPRRTTTYSSSYQAGEAWHSGHSAGKEIVLSRPVAGSSTNRGNLLGPGK